jgi:hypothetical protein
MRRPAHGGDALTGRVRAGEEHAIDRLPQQRSADEPIADDRHEDVLGHAGGMQQACDREPGQRRILGRLVEHRVAGDERGDEDVAADEPRVVPRGNIRDDAERLVRDALLEFRVDIGEDGLVAQRPRRLLDEEIETGQQSVQLVARLPDRLADFPGQRTRERVELGDDALAKRRDRRESLLHRAPRPARLRGARLHVLATHDGRRVGFDVRDDGACCRIVNFHVHVVALMW